MTTNAVADLFADEDTDALVKRAHDHIGEIARNPAAWLLRIPATAKDSDLLLAVALDRLEAERDRYRKALTEILERHAPGDGEADYDIAGSGSKLTHYHIAAAALSRNTKGETP